MDGYNHEDGNEPSPSMKSGILVGQLLKYYFLKQNCTAWN